MTAEIKYDVFISYRGKDTRANFTSHLYAALSRNCIDAFIDGGGEGPPTSLFDKISESLVSVVIFSQSYAHSPSCLDELVKIIESKDHKGQLVLPVFLGIQPTQVEKQTGAFGDGFHRLIQSQQFKCREETWRRALIEAAHISGWNSKHQSEEKIVEEIVNRIEKFLDQISLHDQYDGFVGVSRVDEVESLLNIGSSERMRSIGIWGMGGIGKSTIAKLVFGRLSNRFDGACFITNVRAKLENYGIDYVQKDMILQLLGVESEIKGPYMLPHVIQRRLRRKRLLIVLDDLDRPRHLRALVGQHDMYGPGSRVIVTSRDKQTLKNGCTSIYEVQKLNLREALQLFKLHAFKHNQPISKLIELSKRAVMYAQGLPLALEVLGCNLNDKDNEEWEIELTKLGDIPNVEITDILRSAYDGLDAKEKDIFLDIACLFEGWPKDRVERILDGCGFYAGIGLSCLFDKALITESNETLGMHDLLRQMGQDIVLHECFEDSGKRSRLWRWKDLNDVLTRNMGTEKTEVLSLDLSKTTNMHLQHQVFRRMPRLRILHFGYSAIIKKISSVNSKLLLPDGLEYLPPGLRLFHWDSYPLPCLPPKFHPEHLVELAMRGSRLKQLTSDEVEPCFPNLKRIDFLNSTNLTRLPDFSKMSKLEVLQISFCDNLEQVPVTIQNLKELRQFISLENSSLHSFPECSQLTNLQFLCLDGCSKITRLAEVPQNLTFLGLARTAIRKLPASVGCLSQLQKLMLNDCKELESLPSGIFEMKRLQVLDLGGCSKLESVPETLGTVESLQDLYLEGTATRSLPESICSLRSLRKLDVGYCSSLTKLPEELGKLKSLRMLTTDGCPLEILPSSINHLSLLEVLSCTDYKGNMLPSFTGLPGQIIGSGKHPEVTGLVSLKEVCFRRSNLESLPESIKYVCNLTRLYLSDSKHLICLPELPSSLRRLEVNNCTSLEYTRNMFGEGDERVAEDIEFEFVNCLKLKRDGRNKITSDFWLRIQNLAMQHFSLAAQDQFSWLDQEKYKMAKSRLCIPGSELPEWVNYSSGVGSTLQVKKNGRTMVDGGCRLAFCVVVSVGPECDQRPNKFAVKCEWVSESGEEFVSSSFNPEVPVSYVSCDMWESTLESEHLFLWYDTQEFQTATIFANSMFRFNTVDYFDGSEIDAYQILKCGIAQISRG